MVLYGKPDGIIEGSVGSKTGIKKMMHASGKKIYLCNYSLNNLKAILKQPAINLKYNARFIIAMADGTAKFLRIYANIPDELRKDIIIVVDKKPYTWNTAYLEVKGNTDLGRKILKTMEEIGIL